MSKLGALHVTQAMGAKQTGTVIFFHGSGGTGESMKEWVNLLVRAKKPFAFPHIKILYPSAPLQPYTPMFGEKSNVWFDRYDISPKVPENVESLENIAMEIKRLIKEENELGIPNHRIIVGGFSMGGALALHTAFRWDRTLAGVFAMSSFLNDDSAVYKDLEMTKENSPPLLHIHGESDDLVMMEWGRNTFNKLTSLGVKGEFSTIPKLGHSPDKKGLEMVRDFINKLVPEQYIN